MGKIKVLVVDDSVVVRSLISDVLSSDSNIEVIGVAANGKIAIQKITQSNPDIVTLDVEMPIMDGIETLREIRRIRPKLPVIMFSSVTERGAAVTLEALSIGASDYVTKPSNTGGLEASRQILKQELIKRIYSLANLETKVQLLPEGIKPKPQATGLVLRKAVVSRIDCLAIGVSTGGPNALERVVPKLPKNLGVPVVIVQHMPPLFTKSLAERLDGKSQLCVREGEDGAELNPGTVWVAPGGFHMVVSREGNAVKIRMNCDAPENSCRPAVDVLFRSVVKVYGNHVLGVIMTGMGQDGLRGCEQIAEVGGQIIAQDEATSVVWGMPGFVARAGLAEKILPVDDIAGEIEKKVFNSKLGIA